MEFLPREIIIEIFGYLSFNELIKLQLMDKLFKQIIRKNKWPHITVRPKNSLHKINFIIDNYSFTNYDLSNCNQITDTSVSKLGNCHTLNFSWCSQITDAGVSKLGNCHTLNLSGCSQITNESVSKLGNCHTLNLYGCDKITDASVSKLGNCHTLNLAFCYQITDASALKLGKCHTLSLLGCNKVTDVVINQLRITVKNFY